MISLSKFKALKNCHDLSSGTFSYLWFIGSSCFHRTLPLAINNGVLPGGTYINLPFQIAMEQSDYKAPWFSSNFWFSDS